MVFFNIKKSCVSFFVTTFQFRIWFFTEKVCPLLKSGEISLCLKTSVYSVSGFDYYGDLIIYVKKMGFSEGKLVVILLYSP